MAISSVQIVNPTFVLTLNYCCLFIELSLGSELDIEARWDVIVRTVVIPRDMRAGTASIEIQNDTQLRITIKDDGT